MKQSLLLVLLLTITFLLGAQSSESIELYKQKKLKVAVYEAPPFGWQYEDGDYGGLMVEIWESIAEELSLDYEYHSTDMKGLLTGLQNKDIDVALGAISITPKREKLVDFTQAVNPSGTGVAVAAEAMQSSFQLYWKPVLISLIELIGLLLLVLLVSGTVVWLVERQHNRDKPSDRNIQGLADGLWWSAVTMTTVGYGDKVPNSRIGKVLGIIWIFTSVILLSLFTANASAIMTTSKIQAYIDSEEDLRNSRIAAVRKSSGEEYLIREHLAYEGYDTIEEAIQSVIDGERDCIVSNVPVLKYYNRIKFGNQLLISKKLLLKNNMGIALQDESPLREPIDQILLKKITEPKWQNDVYKYLGEE